MEGVECLVVGLISTRIRIPRIKYLSNLGYITQDLDSEFYFLYNWDYNSIWYHTNIYYASIYLAGML